MSGAEPVAPGFDETSQENDQLLRVDYGEKEGISPSSINDPKKQKKSGVKGAHPESNELLN